MFDWLGTLVSQLLRYVRRKKPEPATRSLVQARPSPREHPKEPHKEIIDGHYHLPNGVAVNLDCMASDCVYFDKDAPPEKNCKKGYNGSLVIHVWGFCKHWKPEDKPEEDD